MNEFRKRILVENKCEMKVEGSLLKVTGKNGTKEIPLANISCLCFSGRVHTMMDVHLVQACLEQGIQLCFEDDKHRISSMLYPLYGTFDTSKKVKEQSMWAKDRKDALALRILKNKIGNQARLLAKLGLDSDGILKEYEKNMVSAWEGNEEGMAARIYFHRLFGNHFDRRSSSVVNAMLNYGYSLLAGRLTQSIVSFGYITQMGIHHASNTNPFNLTYDFIEPFRPLIDEVVFQWKEKTEFTYQDKLLLLERLDQEIHYRKQFMDVTTAMDAYVLDGVSYLNGSKSDIGEILL